LEERGNEVSGMKAKSRELAQVGFGHGALEGSIIGMPRMREPVVDVFERGNEVVVTAQVPGARKEDVKIKVLENGIELQVQAKERKEEKIEDKRHGFYSYSSSSSSEGYSRFIAFRSKVNAKAAKATFKNGVLEVRAPKLAKAQGREAKVE
jgi:HSP20 family protein